MNIFRIFLLLGCCVCSEAYSCSFARVLEPFIVDGSSEMVPKIPDFEVLSISRGERGDAGMCADAGTLTLVSKNLDGENGFIFEIEEGEYDVGLFPNQPVILVERFAAKAEYFFVWLDGNTKEQEPIDILVKITAISKSGNLSEPQYLRVFHPGVQKSWWEFW